MPKPIIINHTIKKLDSKIFTNYHFKTEKLTEDLKNFLKKSGIKEIKKINVDKNETSRGKKYAFIKFFTKKYDASGKNNKTDREIDCHIILHSNTDKRNVIKTGRINSAEDKPNQIILNALPLDLVKYLVIIVDAV